MYQCWYMYLKGQCMAATQAFILSMQIEPSHSVPSLTSCSSPSASSRPCTTRSYMTHASSNRPDANRNAACWLVAARVWSWSMPRVSRRVVQTVSKSASTDSSRRPCSASNEARESCAVSVCACAGPSSTLELSNTTSNRSAASSRSPFSRIASPRRSSALSVRWCLAPKTSSYPLTVSSSSIRASPPSLYPPCSPISVARLIIESRVSTWFNPRLSFLASSTSSNRSRALSSSPCSLSMTARFVCADSRSGFVGSSLFSCPLTTCLYNLIESFSSPWSCKNTASASFATNVPSSCRPSTSTRSFTTCSSIARASKTCPCWPRRPATATGRWNDTISHEPSLTAARPFSASQPLSSCPTVELILRWGSSTAAKIAARCDGVVASEASASIESVMLAAVPSSNATRNLACSRFVIATPNVTPGSAELKSSQSIHERVSAGGDGDQPSR
mmetsp:Transcript_32093/g.74084  ORF Transcript_32093/g.74084 Transcript_32093/m.74084 type:complete len:447 (+) Transcript_32093:612-1952(+)